MEIFYQNMRIAIHQRDKKMNGYTTNNNHMPSSHQFIAEWSAERFLNWGEKIGEDVKEIVNKVLITKEHPEQAFKVCMGILNMEKKYGKERLNRACKRALNYGLYSYKGIKNILDKNLDELYEKEERLALSNIVLEHENVRGMNYYI